MVPNYVNNINKYIDYIMDYVDIWDVQFDIFSYKKYKFAI